MKKVLVVLLDLDLTAIRHIRVNDEKSPGVRRFEITLKEFFGIDADINPQEIAGWIDPQILLEIALKYDVPLKKIYKRMPEMLEFMTKWYKANSGDIEIMPGVEMFLASTWARSITGVLSGNVEGIARYKIGVVGLDEYIQFYACSNAKTYQRSSLVTKALKLLEPNAYIRSLDLVPVIVGDSKRDAQCAKESGIHSIIVPSFSPVDETELKELGASLIVSSLEKLDEVMQFLDSLLQE